MLPPGVRRFIERRIDNIEQLEILLLLHRLGERSWSAEEVAEALRVTPRAAARHLEALTGRNLLDVRLGDEVRYRFAPAVPKLTTETKALADCYRERRSEVVALVAATRRSLRDFSDAFRIKGKRDG